MEKKVEITTNHKYRELLTLEDIPQKARKDFDYIEDEDRYVERIFKYRGIYYDVGQFMPCRDTSLACGGAMFGQLAAWDGYQSDSHFSGVVIKWSKDCEAVKVGTYIA